CTGYYYAMDYW
nr:immunoglobulin heavy chain junction region [Mus musculus]